MKKNMLHLLLTLPMIFTLTACQATTSSEPAPAPSSVATTLEADEESDAVQSQGNYSDDMKIIHSVDISPEDGADSVERDGDHVDSPYFSRLDFYHMESTDTLTILPKFQTLQQTSEWSCGVTSALMVMNYFEKLDDYDELSLSMLRPQQDEPGATSLKQAIAVFDAVGGFSLVTTLDYEEEFDLETIQEFLKQDTPVMVCWNDWGGHWQVIIGYDTMGTETTQDDVLIMADPYDTTDHNQDGYTVYGAERFFYNFTTYNFFDEEEGNDQLFIAVRPAQ